MAGHRRFLRSWGEGAFATFIGVFGVLLGMLACHPPAVAAGEATTGSGTLEATRPDGTSLGPCPLEHTDVTVEISGFVARVRVTQTFENTFTEAIEAVYTFPLSDGAAVDAMTIRTGDRSIRGEIKRREEARRIYERARDRGQLAGLLDQERPNIFTQSIANLVPGAAVEVQIEYVEPLEYEDGRFELSIPTVVGPRFIPGTPVAKTGTGWAPDTDRVPDASRITPPVTPKGTRAGHDIRITVDIDAGVPIFDVASSLHEIDVEREGPNRVRVGLVDRAEIPNRDFVLRYEVAGDAVSSGYLTHRPQGRDGYATFILLPPRVVTTETVAPKEMIFVIDRSGSQRGAPLEKAKETMRWILDHMNPDDTFQIVDFSHTTNMLFETPMPASSEMRRRARSYIESLEANGGTMMAEAVRRVCAVPAANNRLRIVTFMTDGYIGNDFEVLSLVKELRGTSRWFPFGTGNSVNRFLLDSMARLGGGEVDYVLLDSPGEAAARTFYDRIASPVLTDVRLEAEGIELLDLYPREVADVWAERPLIIHARYRRPGTGRVILRGYHQGVPYERAVEVTLPRRAPRGSGIASMWARARVDALVDQDLSGLQSGGVSDQLKNEIVETALEHRIMTQFTSFVAVEDRVVNEGGVQRTVAVPVEMPDGVSYEGVFGESPVLEMREASAYHMRPRASAKASRPLAVRGGVLRGLGLSSFAGRAPRSEEAVGVDAGPVEQEALPEDDRSAATDTAGDLPAIVDSSNTFAIDLFGHLAAEDSGNLFFSPSSIATALAMAYAGASGDTAAEMAKVLNFTLPPERLHPAFGSLIAALNRGESGGVFGFLADFLGGETGGDRLVVANRLWGQQGSGFLAGFLRITRESYGAALAKVDFAQNPEAARRQINDWIAEQTAGKIANLFPRGILNASTRLVLTNAVYFKGTWDRRFDAGATKDLPFSTDEGSTQVPMMFQKAHFGYGEIDDVQVLEMPYAGRDVSMIVLLPRDANGLKALETRLTAEALATWTKRLRDREVEVYFPRFKIASRLALGKVLSAMGMASAFDEGRADFSRMTGARDLFISAVLHEAWVDVDEEGTEAVAATGIGMQLRSASTPSVTFRADHPFVLAIRDNRTGAIIFMGRIANPTA